MNKFTKEDVESCWEHADSYLVEILNGDYKLEDARDDLRSLIGSKWDPRNRIMIEHYKPK